MKRKILSFLLAICLIVPAMFMLSACGDKKAPEETMYGKTYTFTNSSINYNANVSIKGQSQTLENYLSENIETIKLNGVYLNGETECNLAELTAENFKQRFNEYALNNLNKYVQTCPYNSYSLQFASKIEDATAQSVVLSLASVQNTLYFNGTTFQKNTETILYRADTLTETDSAMKVILTDGIFTLTVIDGPEITIGTGKNKIVIGNLKLIFSVQS